ncbi:hypothetical protein IGJ74_001824 [Enterococcus sp. AZ009]|uniref:DUF1617 family protein n=1 Tax=Enterococcus TaxID=1350 RepID=UPI001C47631F|nr:DUF1617 family protein [Enterococcus casseliflavus]
MKLVLKNHEVVKALNFLSGLKLNANQTRPATKLIHLLDEVLQEIQRSQFELIELYGKRDEENNLVQLENGKSHEIDPDHAEDYAREVDLLLNEEVVIDGGPFVKIIEQLPSILENYEEKIDNAEAYIYDRLMDEFEKEENQDVKD